MPIPDQNGDSGSIGVAPLPIVATAPDGTRKTLKLLSENPSRYDDAAIAGIRMCLGLVEGETVPGEAMGTVKMGTTVATNALLERKHAGTAADRPQVG